MEQLHDYSQLPPVARDHATHPRNFGPLRRFSGHSRVTGPCGDTMEFWLVVKDDVVEKVSFVTDGCGASLACGSITTTLAEGLRLQDAAALSNQRVLDALGGLPAWSEHCALLATTTLKSACRCYLEQNQATLSGPATH